MSRQPRRPGRPPSPDAQDKALRAARAILTDEGLGRLTMDAVAVRSGVGKPTLYRHWANALELAMAALMLDDDDPAPRGRTLEARLRAQLRALVRTFSATRGRQIAMALAASDPESEISRAFRNQVILASRETGRGLLNGVARPDEIETLLDMIYGPLFYRLLAGHRPLDAAFADSLAALALRLVAR
ncbi:MAG: TetR/AcrR family transcriptional regulator [Rhodobacteraceae bacterium]|nr:TetR/AcrR family transcriptional regulator [Paracoccaceae bacterium]